MACDEGYAMPLATALRSIAESNSHNWPVSIYILSDGFREQTRHRIQRSLPEGAFSLHWLYLNLDQFANLPTLAHISQMTFARFLLADVMPLEVKRILYLDSDLLVLADLSELWASSLEGHCVGAVLDFGLDPLIKLQDPRCAGVPVVRRYFNAGVLLIDLDLWRQQQIGQRAGRYLAEHPNSPYADQDALNFVLDESWKELAEHWNFQRHLEISVARIMPASRPAIIHFVTANKPWKRELHTPNESLFDIYRGRTQFSRTSVMRWADAWKTIWFLFKQRLKRFA